MKKCMGQRGPQGPLPEKKGGRRGEGRGKEVREDEKKKTGGGKTATRKNAPARPKNCSGKCEAAGGPKDLPRWPATPDEKDTRDEGQKKSR